MPVCHKKLRLAIQSNSKLLQDISSFMVNSCYFKKTDLNETLAAHMVQ